MCESLTSKTGVVKNLVRFISKFMAARLLQKRLFCPEEDAKDFLAMVAESTYGINNCTAWKHIHELSNAALQSYVRRCWVHTSDGDKTSALQAFVSSVVSPCLKVHVGTARGSLVALSSQFVEALSTNAQTAP